MMKKSLVYLLVGSSALVAAAGTATASSIPDIRITEYMYNPVNSPGEFVEFTNLGTTAVDMTGWSEDDSTEQANRANHSLSAFGIVQPGQSVIFTEADPTAFRAAWNLSSSVEVIGPYTNDNLGRSDEINLYDASGNLVDRLTYNDATGQGPRTQGVSGVPVSASVIGTNNAAGWVLSQVGVDGAYASTGGDIGSPGYYPSTVPLPAAGWLLISGASLLAPALRRRKQMTEAR
jgi:predicted extracellular nuclease